MSEVFFEKCANYEFETVKFAMKSLLCDTGLLDFVTPNMKIAIKTNLVSAMKPEKGATTHPMLLCVLSELLTERGASVIIGDSPGGLYNSKFVTRAYNVCGLSAVKEFGAELNSDFSVSEAVFKDGHVMHNFTYTSYLSDCDAIIDFCKLKSHGMMGMTGAVKNMFGVIPGTMKPEYHFKYPKYEDFADMIIDINEYFKTKLSIADAIIGMEGNGPTAGDAKFMGFIGASKSPYTLDFACAEILGLSASQLPILKASQLRGLCPESPDMLICNMPLDELKINDFKSIAAPNSLQFAGNGKNPFKKLFSKIVKKLIAPKPKLKKKLCIGCGVCRDVCPAKAIEIKKGKAVINRELCIKCFCCQEFCPKGAMVSHAFIRL